MIRTLPVFEDNGVSRPDLFKGDGTIRVASEGVSIELPLAPALVLFGPNDSGKSNTLRAIASLVRGERVVPRDSFRLEIGVDWREPGDEGTAIRFDLNLARDDHRALVAEVATPSHRMFGRRILTGGLSISIFVPAEIDETGEVGEWEYAQYSFEPTPPVTSDDILSAIGSVVLKETERCASELGLDGVELPAVVDAWMRRPVLELGTGLVVLDLEGGSWEVAADPGSEHVPDILPRHVWLEADDPVPKLVDAMLLDAADRGTGDVLDDLAKRVLALAGWHSDSKGWYEGFGPPAFSRTLTHDPWFEANSGVVAGKIVALCREVSKTAQEIAPPFVTRDYLIELQPLQPAWWEVNEGHRLRLALIPHNSPKDDDLPTPAGFAVGAVGAGLRIWTVFAVYEALRRSEADPDRATLFLFDEPERHLHPNAQREAAEFVARIVEQAANAIIATHSPVFLNQQIPFARYVRLERVNGVTSATPIDGGALTEIERHAEQLGLGSCRPDPAHAWRASRRRRTRQARRRVVLRRRPR